MYSRYFSEKGAQQLELFGLLVHYTSTHCNKEPKHVILQLLAGHKDSEIIN